MSRLPSGPNRQATVPVVQTPPRGSRGFGASQTPGAPILSGGGNSPLVETLLAGVRRGRRQPQGGAGSGAINDLVSFAQESFGEDDQKTKRVQDLLLQVETNEFQRELQRDATASEQRKILRFSQEESEYSRRLRFLDSRKPEAQTLLRNFRQEVRAAYPLFENTGKTKEWEFILDLTDHLSLSVNRLDFGRQYVDLNRLFRANMEKIGEGDPYTSVRDAPRGRDILSLDPGGGADSVIAEITSKFQDLFLSKEELQDMLDNNGLPSEGVLGLSPGDPRAAYLNLSDLSTLVSGLMTNQIQEVAKSDEAQKKLRFAWSKNVKETARIHDEINETRKKHQFHLDGRAADAFMGAVQDIDDLARRTWVDPSELPDLLFESMFKHLVGEQGDAILDFVKQVEAGTMKIDTPERLATNIRLMDATRTVGITLETWSREIEGNTDEEGTASKGSIMFSEAGKLDAFKGLTEAYLRGTRSPTSRRLPTKGSAWSSGFRTLLHSIGDVTDKYFDPLNAQSAIQRYKTEQHARISMSDNVVVMENIKPSMGKSGLENLEATLATATSGLPREEAELILGALRTSGAETLKTYDVMAAIAAAYDPMSFDYLYSLDSGSSPPEDPPEFSALTARLRDRESRDPSLFRYHQAVSEVRGYKYQPPAQNRQGLEKVIFQGVMRGRRGAGIAGALIPKELGTIARTAQGLGRLISGNPVPPEGPPQTPAPPPPLQRTPPTPLTVIPPPPGQEVLPVEGPQQEGPIRIR